LVLACDGECGGLPRRRDLTSGIWDCLSSQQVVDFVRRAVANGDDLGKICEDLMVKCLATDSETGGIGCDNMTVVVVALLNGRTPEEWRDWVKDRVDRKGALLTVVPKKDHPLTLCSWTRHAPVHPGHFWPKPKQQRGRLRRRGRFRCGRIPSGRSGRSRQHR